jgi:3D (Asp-Asp-Asp) domain-containing protein
MAKNGVERPVGCIPGGTWREWSGSVKKLIIFIQVISILLLLSIPPQVEAEQKYFLMTATGYYPGPECCHPYNDGFTATGDMAGRGCIAIDPKNGPLRFGQKVYIEGYGHGICNDVGSAIKKWKIDLCFDTLEEAQEWGVRLVKVYIVEEK